jgi:hypothetical protein
MKLVCIPYGESPLPKRAYLRKIDIVLIPSNEHPGASCPEAVFFVWVVGKGRMQQQRARVVIRKYNHQSLMVRQTD